MGGLFVGELAEHILAHRIGRLLGQGLVAFARDLFILDGLAEDRRHVFQLSQQRASRLAAGKRGFKLLYRPGFIFHELAILLQRAGQLGQMLIVILLECRQPAQQIAAMGFVNLDRCLGIKGLGL